MSKEIRIPREEMEKASTRMYMRANEIDNALRNHLVGYLRRQGAEAVEIYSAKPTTDVNEYKLKIHNGWKVTFTEDVRTGEYIYREEHPNDSK